jgi:UDP-2-acetamido-2,6-beta-L-arabino-hexul-4-ose reductase
MSYEMEDLPVHTDERGVVFEPIETELLQMQCNVHVVTSQPGAIRGNHYHLKGTETIAAAGPALVRVREGGELRDILIPDGKIYRFVFPPGVPHAIKNAGDGLNMLVAFNTVEHDPQHPDTVQDILIED